jgi:hypothetical protein
LVKVRGDLGSEAVRILRDTPGISVERELARTGGAPDAILQFAGAAEAVAVEVRAHANAATAWQLARRAEGGPGGHLLLVAGDTTAEAREILQRNGISFVDGLGNAHVELPGLLLHLEGNRRPRGGIRGTPPPTRLTGKAGIVAQALLLGPDRRWQVQGLAEEAHVSLGLAHRVLARLETEGLLAAEGTGPKRVRRVADPTALLDLWAEENTDRAVRQTRAYRLAREPRELVGAVSKGLQEAGIEHAVTGAAASALLAPFVTAVPVAEIWFDSGATAEDVVAAAHAEMVEDGHNLVFSQTRGDVPLAFRRGVHGVWAVNPFRLFFDLCHDPRRGREQAENLRREVIGF